MAHQLHTSNDPFVGIRPTIEDGKPSYILGGSSIVNKCKKPLRPCGRGRRNESARSISPFRDIPLPFLKFPAEIRNQIYGYLLTFENDLTLMDHHHADNVRCCGISHVGKPRNKQIVEWSYDDEGNSILVDSERLPSFNAKDLNFIDRSILLVNKQIYNEARGVLLANNALSVSLIDLDAMKSARWETMGHFTRFCIGTLDETMPTMVDLLCSTEYDLRELKITMIIPGAERTRCQYWVKQVKEMLEPLRELHVRGQVEFSWIERRLVDNPEVRKETVEWLEKLGMDMMGGPGNGKRIVTGEERDKEVEDALAAYHASAMAAATAASLATVPAPAQANSATSPPTPVLAALDVSTLPATQPKVTLPAGPASGNDTHDDLES
ncbi:hypothetical protein FKW77_003118 [Venturia effusa]|uniref:Uncharacterized protein n=1 Tax=Venturia effusa TaxID=50376 RepID=A0A517LQZ8_9PEZI|nr:hypothetical protein FKW77_003118 [Venturia effusa]